MRLTAKTLLAIMALALLWLQCAQEGEVDEVDRTVLRVGTDPTYPPFETLDTLTGQPVGFDIGLVQAVCKVRGWELEIVVVPFDQMISDLVARRFDVAASAITITPEREAMVAFSDSYYKTGQTIAVRLADSSITGADDLRGKRVGVQSGTTAEAMAMRIDGTQVYSFDSIGAAFAKMTDGDLDAVLNDLASTRDYIERIGSSKMVGETLSTEEYALALRKTDVALLAAINEALRQMNSAGVYDSLHQVWFGSSSAEN